MDTIYRQSLLFNQAVSMCDLLKIKFSTSAVEICSVQAVFCNITFNRVMLGCVGAIDGLLVVIKCPSMKASDNNPFLLLQWSLLLLWIEYQNFM